MIYTAFLLLFLLFFQCALAQLQCPPSWIQSTIDAQKCYFIETEQLGWNEAEKRCEGILLDAHLTSVLSAFETTNIGTAIRNVSSIGFNDQLWIGAHGINQDEYFTWIDGNALRYTNWLPGQPELMKECVSIEGKSSGKWRTEVCDTKNAFICEYYKKDNAQPLPADCYDLRHTNGITSNGVYQLYPDGIEPFLALCDMETDGGGWTVFQKRQDSSLIFWSRGWTDYKYGFNNGLEINHWLGLEHLHLLSNKDNNVEMRIDVWGDRTPRSPVPNEYWFGTWQFRIANETEYYRLSVLSNMLSGNATLDDQGMKWYDNMTFNTLDCDHGPASGNCAHLRYYGPWWHNACTDIAPNGKYTITIDDVMWEPGGLHCKWKDGPLIRPRRIEMKLRRVIQ